MAQQSAQITFAFLAKDYASKTVRGLSNTLSGLGKVAGKVGSGISKGLKAAAIGIGAALTAAAGAAVLFTKSAIEDEAAQSKLVAVLKQRNLASEANLATVDKLIAAGAELAFTDDEVRAGLATATQFTKNFADSQRILATAQDVARAKNISLEEATSLVGKAYQGNTKGLKSLGVETKKGAKGLSVLAAVNKKFAGSAGAYSKTTAGQFAVLQNTLMETGEEIGYVLLPIFNELMTVFAKEGVPIIKAVAAGISDFITKNKDLIKSVIGTVVSVAQNLLPIFGKIATFIFTKIIPAVVGFVSKLTSPGGVIDSVGKVVGPIVQKLIPAFGNVIDVFGKVASSVGRLAATLWGDGNGPLAAGVKLLGGVFEVFLGILGNVLGLIEKIISATATAIQFIIKLADEQRAGAQEKYLRMGGVAPVQVGGSGFNPVNSGGAASPGFNQYYNVYVGATAVAKAVVPVVAKDVRINPRSGR